MLNSFIAIMPGLREWSLVILPPRGKPDATPSSPPARVWGARLAGAVHGDLCNESVTQPPASEQNRPQVAERCSPLLIPPWFWMSCYDCMHKDIWRFSDFNYDYYLLWEMFFLPLGNLFSWFALKQQQTAVNSPVVWSVRSCWTTPALLRSPCFVPLYKR